MVLLQNFIVSSAPVRQAKSRGLFQHQRSYDLDLDEHIRRDGPGAEPIVMCGQRHVWHVEDVSGKELVTPLFPS